ncbi:MAG: hypothetical protein ACMUIA_11605 [bacterium]
MEEKVKEKEVDEHKNSDELQKKDVRAALLLCLSKLSEFDEQLSDDIEEWQNEAVRKFDYSDQA